MTSNATSCNTYIALGTFVFSMGFSFDFDSSSISISYLRPYDFSYLRIIIGINKMTNRYDIKNSKMTRGHATVKFSKGQTLLNSRCVNDSL